AQGSARSPRGGGERAAPARRTDSTWLGALAGVIEYRALGWLRFGAAPTLVRSTAGSTTTSGFGDLPLALEASKQWGAPFRPELGASVIVTLPTGRAACGLGDGQARVGMNFGVGIDPSEEVTLSADASQRFVGAF